MGDTVPPMLTSLFSMWLVQIPLAYVFAHFTNLGVYGIRWAMAIGVIVSSSALAIYFKLGKWQNRRF
jgi:Na+-driven multidrug efflux pump